MLSFKGLLAIASSISLIALVTATPFLTNAKLSKTYTINAAAAKNYTTSGISLTGTTSQASWYNPSWQYRQQITIHKDYIGEELTDFPVVIRLDDQSLTGARDDRHDLLFTSSDGTTKLAHQRESASEIWVKVPKLTPTADTIIYLYYGNPTAEDQANPEEVWSNNYAGVWHMNEDPAGSTKDATGNEHTGTSFGAMNRNDSLKEGKVGKAVLFDGANDYVNLGAVNTSYITEQAWVKTTGNGHVATKHIFFDPQLSSYALHVNPRAVFHTTTEVTGKDAVGTTTVNDDTWHHLVGTYDGSLMRIYVDGVLEATAEQTGNVRSNSQSLLIANYSTQINAFFGGTIDELRISSVARSSSWIAAEHANQSGDEGFLTISPIESSPTSSTTTPSITLKPTKALSFSSLSSFSYSGSGSPTFQLSPDKGTTWYYNTTKGWSKTTTKSSSHNDITKHLKTFPKGTGQLLWRAFLPTNSTLDSITIQYEPAATKATSKSPTSLDDPRIQAINTLFTQVNSRPPTYDEWLYWTNRVINGEKTTQEALLGAMQWQKGIK